MSTGFLWDERCFWHTGGNYVLTTPVGGLVQPSTGSGLAEDPETKRRLRNLVEVTGLGRELIQRGAAAATREELLRVHTARYLDAFKALSDAGGGELGHHAPFSTGSYEIATLSSGLVRSALFGVLDGDFDNAYALSRPPGHHCLSDESMGFCLLNNIAIAIEAAIASGRAGRFVVLDWDVHHGNGTEAIFYERQDVLTISMHQAHNYPLDSGAAEDRGRGAGAGANLNIPLPPGAGHKAYLEAMERLVLPSITRFGPDVIIVASGFDAGLVDPLSRMLATAETFGSMTGMLMELAADITGGRLVMAHEGGYSEVYVPFCGHRVLEVLSGSTVHAADPYAETFRLRQPEERFDRFVSEWLQQQQEALPWR